MSGPPNFSRNFPKIIFQYTVITLLGASAMPLPPPLWRPHNAIKPELQVSSYEKLM